MNEFLKGQIYTYCELVIRGKPAAIISIQDRYAKETIDIVKSNKLYYLIEELSAGWKTLWIYKYKYMEEIIKKMPEKPKTIYDHWVLGKIFGYSDEAIKEFLETEL